MVKELRCAVWLTIASWLVLGLTIPASAADAPMQVRHARLTAAPKDGLSVVLATVVNRTQQPITIYRITSSVANPAMLHYDVNMCQKGHQMTLLPMVVVPAHRTLDLSTQGVGAMLTPLRRSLHIGETIKISVTYSVNLKRQTLEVPLRIVAAPKGLATRPPKSSVG